MFISSEADPLSRCWLMPKGTPHKTQTNVPRCDEGSQLPDHRVRAWGLSRELEKSANHELLDGQRISLFSRKVAQEAVRLFHLKRGQIMDANRTHNRATKATGAMICGPLEFHICTADEALHFSADYQSMDTIRNSAKFTFVRTLSNLTRLEFQSSL